MDINNIDDLKKNCNNIDVNETLFYSAKFNYYEGIEIAIKNGADIHYERDLILYSILNYNNYVMSEYLISIGADINVNDEEFLNFSINNDDFEKSIQILKLGGNLTNIKNSKNKKAFLAYLRKYKLNKIYNNKNES